MINKLLKDISKLEMLLKELTVCTDELETLVELNNMLNKEAEETTDVSKSN